MSDKIDLDLIRARDVAPSDEVTVWGAIGMIGVSALVLFVMWIFGI